MLLVDKAFISTKLGIVMTRYVHSESIHNIDSADVIVPLVLSLLKIDSVVDFGCGLGNFLKSFKKNGVSTVLGLDGYWTDKDKVLQNLEEHEFQIVDLEGSVILDQRFDLAVCLEVAEHLNKEFETVLVESLIKASDAVLFSAALPGQGGQNHINEKWLSGWIELFERYNYVPCDIIRPQIWEDDRVKWWYRQNILLFVEKENELAKLNSKSLDLIHPSLFERKLNAISDLKLQNQKLQKYKLKAESNKTKPWMQFKLFIRSLLNKVAKP